jgi:PD-(D/E)XK endonuclease
MIYREVKAALGPLFLSGAEYFMERAGAGCLQRGEWAELEFMARAAERGLRVSKPYGNSGRYDVVVENDKGRLWRVQVKSTLYWRRNREYSLNVLGPKRTPYRDGDIDFLAILLVPLRTWYIIPFAATRRCFSLHFTAHSKRHKWRKYREAWELLRGK